MKRLNNPYTEYKDAYETAFELYGNFNEYLMEAKSPSGSLTTFNQKTGEISSRIVKKIKEFEVRLPLK